MWNEKGLVVVGHFWFQGKLHTSTYILITAVHRFVFRLAYAPIQYCHITILILDKIQTNFYVTRICAI